MLDIMIARITHVEWVYQLEMILKKRSTTVSLKSHNECDLGIWLYNEGLKVYEEIPEIELLEECHKAFHYAAAQVGTWHNSAQVSPQQTAQAELDFEEAQRMSKEIVYLLTMLEYKMLRKHQESEKSSANVLKKMIRHPWKTLNSVIGEKESGLNVSKVSLDVLRKDIERTGGRKR